MSAPNVDVTFRNPADPRRSGTGPIPMDTGAFDSLVPKVRLEALGLEPRGSREYSLANGERRTANGERRTANGERSIIEIAVAEIEFES